MFLNTLSIIENKESLGFFAIFCLWGIHFIRCDFIGTTRFTLYQGLGIKARGISYYVLLLLELLILFNVATLLWKEGAKKINSYKEINRIHLYLDLSRSMSATDVGMGRMQLMQKVAKELIKNVSGEYSLNLFAIGLEQLVPLTPNRDSVLHSLDRLQDFHLGEGTNMEIVGEHLRNLIVEKGDVQDLYMLMTDCVGDYSPAFLENLKKMTLKIDLNSKILGPHFIFMCIYRDKTVQLPDNRENNLGRTQMIEVNEPMLKEISTLFASGSGKEEFFWVKDIKDIPDFLKRFKSTPLKENADSKNSIDIMSLVLICTLFFCVRRIAFYSW